MVSKFLIINNCGERRITLEVHTQRMLALVTVRNVSQCILIGMLFHAPKLIDCF